MKELNAVVQEWLDEISAAKKREKDFFKDGKDVLDIYSGNDSTPFNILYANTETLSPALYSSTPRPVVRPQHHNKSPIAKAVADAGTRMLVYLVDNSVREYEDFDSAMNAVVLDALLPGRGNVQIKYDAEIEGEEENESLKWASVCADSRKWDRMYYGYATKWEKVPWVAYEDYLDEDECKALFDKDVVAKIRFTSGENEEEDEGTETDRTHNKGNRKTALIYQIWDKAEKKVKYISPAYHDGYLDELDDPLSISGFFNCPKPLQLVKKSNDLMPTSLYSLYESQAKELNEITKRLKIVTRAIKVRGAYNGALGDELERVMDEDDTALIPASSASGLADGGFEKNIWLMPIDKLILVARELMLARESVKQTIYEITGISDIVRGQSKASETLGAQELKASWGTMRLKNMQKYVQMYARDVLRIMLDVAVMKLPERLWIQMTGLDYLTEEQEAQLQQQLQMLQMQAQQMPPPDPNMPDKQLIQAQQKMQQQMMQLQQQLQKPRWKDVLAALQDDYSRSYLIDIETNSTLDVEATEDKKLIGEFMNALAQLMNGMMPMMEKGVLPFPAFKSLLLEIAQRYRFGREVLDEINSMQPPKGGDPKKMQEAQKKLMQEQQKFKEEQKRVGDEFDKKANDLQMREIQLKHKGDILKKELEHAAQMKAMEQNMDKKEAQSELQQMIQKHKSDIQSMLDKHMANVQKNVQKAKDADIRV